MAKAFRIPLRIVFYKEEGAWIAHCLEFDLVGDGDTIQAALQRLTEAIFVQIETSLECDNLANLFTPADGKFFEMFSAGQEIGHGELDVVERIERDNVVIESTEYRQYAEEDDLRYADSGGLVPAC